MGWVKLHPHNIAQKVQIVVEHYRSTVASLLDGKAKAMVVVGSRLEAVRWQLAIEKYISEKQYGIKSLVAFSGEVDDPETSAEPLKEHSKVLNPGLNNRDIREAFKEDDFGICWSPINSRQALINHCCVGCTSINDWREFRQCRPFRD